MADTCFVEDGEPSASSKRRPRTSRRRKMDFLELHSIADVQPNESKRSKVHIYHRDCHNAEENSLQNEKREAPFPVPARAWPKYGVTSVCGRRRDMEDAVSIHPSFCCWKNQNQNLNDVHFFGVFDGHGCSHVAKSCENRMHEILKEEIENELEELSMVDWKKMMQGSFERMDDEVKEYRYDSSNGSSSINCRCELQTPQQYDMVGSTALVSVLTPDKIITSNCGDSRAVLWRKGAVVPLSSDHKPDRPDELVRIESAGGRVMYWDGPRVLGVLAMSRAIGDQYLKPFLIAEPEVMITERTAEDEFMILASDGLWDVISNDAACGAVRMCMRAQGSAAAGSMAGSNSDKTCSDASILLMKLAMARHSSDNISVVVVDLRKDRHHQTDNRVE